MAEIEGDIEPRTEWRDCPSCGAQKAVQCDVGLATIEKIPDDAEWTQARVEQGIYEGMKVHVLLSAVCLRCDAIFTQDETFRWHDGQ